MESRFEEWFTAQHGRREKFYRDKSDDDLLRMVSELEAIKQELQRRNEWDARHESALYAYNAFDKNLS